jgi:hypothetical protein
VSWLRTLDVEGIGLGLIFVAAVLTAVAQLWTRWVGPFLARPIGRTIGAAIRAELRELVEEVVTQLLATLLHDLGRLHTRTTAIEEKVNGIEQRIVDHHRSPHPTPPLGP